MPRKAKTPVAPEPEQQVKEKKTLNQEYDEFVAEQVHNDLENRVYFELDTKPEPKKKRARKPKEVGGEAPLQPPTEKEGARGNAVSPPMMVVNGTFHLDEVKPPSSTPEEPHKHKMNKDLQRIVDELAKASRMITKISNIVSAVSSKL